RRACLLRHGQGWLILSQRGATASDIQVTRRVAHGPNGLDVRALHFRELWPASRLHYFCSAGFLRLDHHRIVRAAAEASGGRAPLSRCRLSRAPGNLYCDGLIHRYRVITLQAAVHLAGAHHRAARNSGLLAVVEKLATSGGYSNLTEEKPNGWQICL